MLPHLTTSRVFVYVGHMAPLHKGQNGEKKRLPLGSCQWVIDSKIMACLWYKVKYQKERPYFSVNMARALMKQSIRFCLCQNCIDGFMAGVTVVFQLCLHISFLLHIVLRRQYKDIKSTALQKHFWNKDDLTYGKWKQRCCNELLLNYVWCNYIFKKIR